MDEELETLDVENDEDVDGNEYQKPVVTSTHKKQTQQYQKFGSTDSISITDTDDTVIEYKFQFPGVEETVTLKDNAKSADGVFIWHDYYKSIMDVVLVSPRTDFDYWENHKGFGQVMEAGVDFLERFLYE
ncbi:hypothetical protein EQG49_12830 [Periweissella cryptocerci]|uniref:Uncharacterized protein n=1 Tax=Periweissella cryptocerci TaxID=2506420 RepID=A0A4P6YWU9_9LACO|nr:hypothetical protein [Periweissella cryptocerci]QBO37281.1 hypothetical protein EQG49_12830 [Periweissella cryptocerci]